MPNVKEYVSIRKLGSTKDMKALDAGIGCRFEDANGLNAFYHNGEPMQYLGYIEFAPNKSRGDHYHKIEAENLCLIKGNLRAAYYLPDSPDEKLTIDLSPGDVVTVRPGCVHSYVSKKVAVALVYAPEKFNSADVYKI